MSLELLYEYSMEPTKELVALCSSRKCAPTWKYTENSGYERNYDSLKKSKKNVKPNTTYCPDCGYVLLWKKRALPLPRRRVPTNVGNARAKV